MHILVCSEWDVSENTYQPLEINDFVSGCNNFFYIITRTPLKTVPAPSVALHSKRYLLHQWHRGHRGTPVKGPMIRGKKDRIVTITTNGTYTCIWSSTTKIYSVAVNQVMMATENLPKWWLQLNHQELSVQ